MSSHTLRLWILGVLVLAALAALVVMAVVGGEDTDRVIGIIEGVLGTSSAGLLDSMAVARRAKQDAR